MSVEGGTDNMTFYGKWGKVAAGTIVAVAAVMVLLAVLHFRPQQHGAPIPPRPDVASHAQAEPAAAPAEVALRAERDVPAGPADAEDTPVTEVEHAGDDVPAESADVAENAVLHAAEDLVTESVNEQPQPRLLRTQERVDAQVEVLKGETLEESLANLHDMDLFRWPGSGYDSMEMGGKPLLPDCGWYEVHTVMSNRRVVKIIQELSLLEKGEAARMLARQLRSSLEVYKRIFREFLEKHADDLGPSAAPQGIGYRASNNPDGTPTLRGMRWKILSLVFISGELNLVDTRPAVLEACDCAVAQREELYDESPHNLPVGLILLTDASLYNRQILASALVGTSKSPADLEAVVGNASGTWQSRDLASWDAVATPYDLRVRFGEVPVDYSKGRLDVRYLRKLSDETFDAVLKAAREE